MKKKNLFKRIAALAMSAAMVLGVVNVANAATIDDTATGSLTVNKYVEPENEGDTLVGIEGVEFKFVKVGDFALTDGNVNGFTLEDSLKNLLTLTPVTTEGSVSVYDGSAIQDALTTALGTNKTQIEALVSNGTTLTTGANGVSNTVNNLDLGLYLVVETKAPAEVVQPSAPFIVSVPTLVTAENGDQSWNYNVVAQPKNSTELNPDPRKTVTGTTTETIPAAGEAPATTRNTASVGDVLTYTLSTNIIDQFGTLANLGFTDTMSKGLTLVDQNEADITDLSTLTNVFKVEGLAKDATDYSEITSGVTFAASKESDGTTKLTITFGTPDTTIKGIYTDIRVSYKAKINEDAVVGGVGNTNDADLIYGNNATSTHDIVPVDVYTYGFELQKNNENSAALADATFKLYDAATGGNEVPFYTSLDATNSVGTAATNNEVTTGTDGKAGFYGLAAGTYYLEETKAPTGYNLLKERVAVTVGANTTGGDADITIVNTKGFTLPTTGGMGTVIFTVVGIVVMLGAAFLLIKANKKSKA